MEILCTNIQKGAVQAHAIPAAAFLCSPSPKQLQCTHFQIFKITTNYTPLFKDAELKLVSSFYPHPLYSPTQHALMYPILHRHTAVPTRSYPHWVLVTCESERLC